MFTELASPLRAFIARRAPAGADVDDLVQTVWLRMHEGISQLRDRERVGAWMFQIARNVIVDAARSSRRERPLELDEVEAPEADETDAARAATRCLAPLIEQLEEPHRTTL